MEKSKRYQQYRTLREHLTPIRSIEGELRGYSLSFKNPYRVTAAYLLDTNKGVILVSKKGNLFYDESQRETALESCKARVLSKGLENIKGIDDFEMEFPKSFSMVLGRSGKLNHISCFPKSISDDIRRERERMLA